MTYYDEMKVIYTGKYISIVPRAIGWITGCSIFQLLIIQKIRYVLSFFHINKLIHFHFLSVKSNIALFSPLIRRHGSIFPYRNQYLTIQVIWFRIQRIYLQRGFNLPRFPGKLIENPRGRGGDGKERWMKENMRTPPNPLVLISDSTEK